MISSTFEGAAIAASSADRCSSSESNELGGSVCEVDELFIRPARRGRGLGSSLFRALEQGALSDEPFVAIVLIVTDGNARPRSAI